MKNTDADLLKFPWLFIFEQQKFKTHLVLFRGFLRAFQKSGFCGILNQDSSRHSKYRNC